jgi:hypothetical protein
MASANARTLEPISASELNFERITSTSGNCATGLKKWSPISRAGCGAAVRDALELDRDGIGGKDRARLRACQHRIGKDRALDLEVLDHRLDDHIGPRQPEPFPVGSASSRRTAALTDLGFFLQPLLEQLLSPDRAPA